MTRDTFFQGNCIVKNMVSGAVPLGHRGNLASTYGSEQGIITMP